MTLKSRGKIAKWLLWLVRYFPDSWEATCLIFFGGPGEGLTSVEEKNENSSIIQT